MSAREIAVEALLGAAGLVVVLSGVGLLAAPTVWARLHFLSPLTSLAAPLVAVAYCVDQGFGLAGGLVLAIAAVLVLTGPPLGSAVARVEADRRGAEAPR